MAGDHPVPFEREHAFDRVLEVRQVGVGHVAEMYALDRNEVDGEQDALARQPHHQRVVRVIFSHIDQFEIGAAERDRALVVDGFIDRHDVGAVHPSDGLLGEPVRHEGRAGVLERLAAGDVVGMAVAVDDVADRRLRDFPDFGEIGIRCRTVLADRIGGDDSLRRHHEHGLMALVAEHVDVVGDLGGCEGRLRGLLCLGRGGADDRCQRDRGRREQTAVHGRPLAKGRDARRTMYDLSSAGVSTARQPSA